MDLPLSSACHVGDWNITETKPKPASISHKRRAFVLHDDLDLQEAPKLNMAFGYEDHSVLIEKMVKVESGNDQIFQWNG